MMLLVSSHTASHAQQESDFAAIAYSPLTRRIGIAQDRNSRATAEEIALRNCQAEPNSPTDCKNAAWVKAGCAALAVSSNGAWGGHYAADQDMARRNAIAQCQRYAEGADTASCAVLTVLCTTRR